MRLIIGTYTEQLPHVHGKADGILTASFDEASGSIGQVTMAAAVRNPSYLALSARLAGAPRWSGGHHRLDHCGQRAPEDQRPVICHVMDYVIDSAWTIACIQIPAPV